MHSESLKPWAHGHVFLGDDHGRNERRTRFVILLTAAMMVAEIVTGITYGSMALLADGFHMATHAGALFISVAAYGFARRHVSDHRFTFGTGKMGDLAGFASAIILALIALLIGYESLIRFMAPVAIKFDEAIFVAVIGLAVNLVSAWLLRDDHSSHGHHGHNDHQSHGGHEPHAKSAPHAHEHNDHGHPHEKNLLHRDNNLRAAYLHVIADAATSILAIIALLAGRFYGWVWMDPIIGIVGAVVIAWWSYGLMRDAGAVLIDMVPDPQLLAQMRIRLEVDGDRVADIHLWRVGPGHNAAAVTLISDALRAPNDVKSRLEGLMGLSHITIEVQACPDHASEKAA